MIDKDLNIILCIWCFDEYLFDFICLHQLLVLMHVLFCGFGSLSRFVAGG